MLISLATSSPFSSRAKDLNACLGLKMWREIGLAVITRTLRHKMPFNSHSG